MAKAGKYVNSRSYGLPNRFGLECVAVCRQCVRRCRLNFSDGIFADAVFVPCRFARPSEGIGQAGWFLEAVFHHDLTGNAVAVHGVTHVEQRLESVFDHFGVAANHKPCGFRGELGMQCLFDAAVF